ncbi:exodeoxyribonuclease V subunit gamma [Nicoliella spurrieriana]|uniref:ATP-dependent helicase/deoxyribonuclease subunit B n=1 Tax=Nicoliella spurrieriana TaxID=2925830 RepID=A0A976X5S5_9LACO|nr:PD-(D/E)XK nuclease family protein [Nicoliella spurrieriana]UQS87195.1 exodeoxyribonuclease V subunit gamma [Nicoliella spurrieriana]
MALQFILGTADKNHAQTLTDLLQTMIHDRPNDRYFYLVPNHIKFESEVKTLERLNRHHDDVYAQTNVQIFSLTRLAWFFLSHEPEYQIPRLSGAGVNMLLYQIINEQQEQLTVFRGESGQPGFINQIASQIAEMESGRVSPDDLADLYEVNHDALSPSLRDKLHDFTIIYREFEEATVGKFIHQNDTLKLLCNYLMEADLSQMHFFISGFSQLSAQERELVMIMIQKAANVTIDLNLDRPAVRERADEPDLFFQPAKLYHQLYQFANDHHVHVKFDLYAKQERVNNDLLALNNYWIQSSGVDPIQKTKLFDDQSIQVVKADNYYAELTSVAIQIRQLVASGQYHYRDILVMTRHLDKYQNIIQPIFKMQAIPYFNDVQKSMVDHPLVQLIDALFNIEPAFGARSYRYDDVMRLLKTELLLPRDENGHLMDIKAFRDALALTENVVLKNGYEGSRWLQDDDWQYRWLNDADFESKSPSDEQVNRKINLIRHYVKDTFPPFFKRMRRAKDVPTAAKWLYQFLVEQGVVERLKQWRDTAVERGDLSAGAQPEQVWQTFCSLLDDFVTVLGEHQTFKLADFLELLKAGFEGANYSQIPSTLDQVAISESGIVQMQDYKVVFMIGATDDVMPDRITDDNLFNDSDRDDLTKYFGADQYLRDTSISQMANDSYLNYLAFLTGSERLIFSYCLANDSDSETGVQISPYVDRIKRHFQIQEYHYVDTPNASHADIMPYVGTQRTTLRHLVQASYDHKYNHHDMADSWNFVYAELINASAESRALTEKLLGGLDYHNTPTRLTNEIVTGLYGNTIETSISQLEQFYSNPYEYFLKYGLKLHERAVFELSSASTGEFYHAALDMLVKRLQAEQIDLKSLDEQDVNQLVNEVANQLLNDPNNFQYAILHSSSRMNYLKTQLIKTVERMALTMHWQSQSTPMRPRDTEISFGRVGKGPNLDPLTFDLSNQIVIPGIQTLKVRGRIDRIDSMNTEDKRFLELIDYKSGNKSIDFGQVYDGTAMQLITYLDVIKKNLDRFSQEQKAELAGALYFHVFNPKLTPKDLEKHDFKTAMMKKQKYSGVLVDDRELISLIDDQIKTGGNSVIYPIGFNKGGEKLSHFSKVIEPDDLDLILQHTEQLIQNAGVRIFNGDVQLAPVKDNNMTAMQYSPFKSIMQFDPLLSENNYRNVESLGMQEVIAKLREERKHGLH